MGRLWRAWGGRQLGIVLLLIVSAITYFGIVYHRLILQYIPWRIVLVAIAALLWAVAWGFEWGLSVDVDKWWGITALLLLRACRLSLPDLREKLVLVKQNLARMIARATTFIPYTSIRVYEFGDLINEEAVMRSLNKTIFRAVLGHVDASPYWWTWIACTTLPCLAPCGPARP